MSQASLCWAETEITPPFCVIACHMGIKAVLSCVLKSFRHFSQYSSFSFCSPSPWGHKELNVTGQLNNNNFWITLVDQENVDFHVYWHYFWGQLSKEEIKKKRKQIDGQVDKGNWQKINISLEQFSMEREFSGIENGSSQEDLWLMKSNCHRTFGGKKDTHIICTKARKCMGNELI